jgi:hypothetical protein
MNVAVAYARWYLTKGWKNDGGGLDDPRVESVSVATATGSVLKADSTALQELMPLDAAVCTFDSVCSRILPSSSSSSQGCTLIRITYKAKDARSMSVKTFTALWQRSDRHFYLDFRAPSAHSKTSLIAAYFENEDDDFTDIVSRFSHAPRWPSALLLWIECGCPGERCSSLELEWSDGSRTTLKHR